MSEFHVRVVEIGPIIKHPNADTLSITMIGGDGGYPVILRTGDYREGDRAVYVPVGAAVPADDPRWAFLVRPGSTKTHVEIDAKRLRGTFSMGLLTLADPSWELGRDVAVELRVERAEAIDASALSSGDNEPDPGLMPTYTDIEGLRAHPNVLVDGEEVVITEKLHGENARFCVGNGRLYCGSRTRWKAPDARTAWTITGERLRLFDKLSASALREPPVGIFGELYGNNAGMRYDANAGARGLRLFDAMNLLTRSYVDFDSLLRVAAELELPTVPVLYRGPWSRDLVSLADGPSTLAGEHVREGIVVRPVHERIKKHVGRVILKRHGEAYLLKKWKVSEGAR